MNTQLAALYETDYSAWALRNAELLRGGRLELADIDHIGEELEGMARRDRNELVSRLIILLAHLLKWQYQLHSLNDLWREFSGKSWQCSIDEQRMQIQRQLKLSPSLKAQLEDAVQEAYPDAIKLAARESGLPRERFPERCPYAVGELLDEDFMPSQ
jgi:hypothetical protein